MTDEVPDWFYQSVCMGLGMLLVLHLRGAPGHETIEFTEQVWVDLLWGAPVQWDQELDEGRIQRGFRKLGREVDQWPAPKQLLSMLPARKQRVAMGRYFSNDELAANIQRMKDIMSGKTTHQAPPANRRKAPWPDFAGQEIFEGSVIEHPEGEQGTVFFRTDYPDPADQWCVDYGDGVPSRLILQIGEKGMARVIKQK